MAILNGRAPAVRSLKFVYANGLSRTEFIPSVISQSPRAGRSVHGLLAFFMITAAQAARMPGGTVAEQCRRQKPMFPGLHPKTLFRRFEIFFRARRAPLNKLEQRG